MDSRYELETAHLRLHALSYEEAALALRGDRQALGARLGATVPEGWPSPDLTESLPTILAEMRSRPGDERWLWVIIEPHAAAVIGDIGFHGPVRETATVELGYLIFPAYQGRGYATEAALALLTWAASQPGVERVVVRIAPDNGPSLRVAEKLSMRETASTEPAYRRFEWAGEGQAPHS
ncbi:MAG TPA: GNAT family N-acetyltransferase [Ktedonobacterales bacterium]